MANQTASNNGVGFTGLLLLVFITLKLCDVIDWSWGWVLAPLWIPIALVLVILLVWWVVRMLSPKKSASEQAIENAERYLRGR